ncbi:MAG TPA: hypothetical protein VH880_03825 [Anaeromyxobacteraceae bacterium]
MDAALRPLLQFLEEQKARQASHFPSQKYEKVLSFMGTTSLAGTHAAVGVSSVHRLEAAGARELRVHLEGELPRPPGRGECVTVHITDVDRYLGFQIKTRALVSPDASAELAEPRPGGVVLHGTQIFTVHHSPYTMKFFERIPHDEVLQTVGAVPVALVAVGETANLSPRFIFHHEERLGRLALYHGDGLALKTYMNLKSNRQETRLVLDLDAWTGFALKGTVEEFQPHQHPEAYDRICQGFAAGNWGKPSRVFRMVADTWEAVAPAAASAR